MKSILLSTVIFAIFYKFSICDEVEEVPDYFICELEPEYCITDFKSVTFREKLFGISKLDRLININQFVANSHLFKIKFNIEFDKQGDPKAVYQETHTEGDHLMVVPNEKYILQEKSYGRNYLKSFPEIDEHEVILNRLMFGANERSNFLKTLTVILYHFYHIEHSKFKYDLQFIKEEWVPPVLTFTNQEINLLKHLKENEMTYLRTNIDQFVKTHKNFTYLLKDDISDEESVSLFGFKIDEIPKQDFAFAYFFIERSGIINQFKETGKSTYFIAPVIHHFDKELIEKKGPSYRIFFLDLDTYAYELTMNANVTSGDQLFSLNEADFAFKSYLIKGIIQAGAADCVNVKIYPEPIVKRLGRKGLFSIYFRNCLHATL